MDLMAVSVSIEGSVSGVVSGGTAVKGGPTIRQSLRTQFATNTRLLVAAKAEKVVGERAKRAIENETATHPPNGTLLLS